MASLDSSIVIISLPAIFRGIALNPLDPANIGYLLWMLMGYMMCTAVLVVTFGRLGDMFGRVRMYNAGFLIFTLASVALSLTPGHGRRGGALYDHHAHRAGRRRLVPDGEFGGDPHRRFPRRAARPRDGHQHGRRHRGSVHRAHRRRHSGRHQLAAHLLDQRAVRHLRHGLGILEIARHGRARRRSIDWWGNITFALGLISILVGITYGIQPYGDTLWAGPARSCSAHSIGGVALLIAFVIIESNAQIADVQSEALQHPRVHRRQHRGAP